MSGAVTILDRLPESGTSPALVRPLRILAYVHLRNIHGSTGAGRTARQIVEHLSRLSGVDLQILADAADQARILPLVQEPWTGFRYQTFARDTSSQQARWFFLNSPKAEEFWPEADIVFCTGESYVPVRKAKLVVTAHDAGYFEPGAHTRDLAFWKTRLKWDLLFRKLERKVDFFHTVSNFSAERLAHFFPSIRSRLRVAYNGVTPRFFGPVSSAGREYLASAGLLDRPFILIPGGLHFRKNADLILATLPSLVTRFRDLIVAIVNHANPMYAERAVAISPNIHLLGFVSDEALHALYASASIVWYPSRYEGFGLPIVESMACGTPVVGSNSASIPEIAGDAALLCDPEKPEAHLDAMSALLTDDAAHRHFSEAGRERASMFTWDRCAATLKREFDALV